MAVTAVAHEVARAGLERVVEVEALDGAAAPLPLSLAERDDHRRAVEPLDHARRDDAHDARVPAVAREDEPARAGLHAGGGVEDRLFQDAPLELLARLVLAIELLRERLRADRVVLEEEPDPAARVVEPPRRVDPRPEAKPDLARRDLRPLRDPGHALQRAHAGAPAPREHPEPPAHQDPVRADERDHVGDRPERDEVERVLQVRLRPIRLVPPPLPQHLAERHREGEGHPDGGEVLRRVGAAGLVRVQDRGRRRQLDRDGVVVHDDRVEPERGRGADLRRGGDPAVERDEEPGALRGELLDGGEVEPVPLDQPVRDVGEHVGAARAQEAGEERRRGHAVHVVVAVERDPLPALDRADDPRDGGVHALHRAGVGQLGEARREERLRLRRLGEAPRGEHPPGERMQPERVRQPRGPRQIHLRLDPPPPRRSVHGRLGNTQG